ncbi:tRNA pseudouridine(38-40) synthase TruA [bacterium]|nr:tRNA pseudouridine(38-40) synthase TruA [bacterium]
MPNYLLELSYDGRDFAGWQLQRQGERTVQGEVELALAELFEPGTRVTAAGRTDAGVHAVAMPASFESKVERDDETVVRALNATLPPDVKVRRCRHVPQSFSARFSAAARVYRYQLESREIFEPLSRLRWARVGVAFDWSAVHNALAPVVGEHDFTSFRAAGCTATSPIRVMHRAELTELGDGRGVLEFEANGFLRNMVRSLVGTLIEIGEGRRPAGDMAALLEYPNRDEVGKTAPAHGLYFVTARYPELDE